MSHDCLTASRTQRPVRWIYPESVPNEPFFMIPRPCSCGKEVRFDTIPVHSSAGRRLEATYQERLYYINANRALAGRLGDLENNNEELEDRNLQRNQANHLNGEPISRRSPNLLHPVWDDWLADPENFNEEPLEENLESENFPIVRFHYTRRITNSDYESDADR